MSFLVQLDHRLFFLINNGLGCEWLDDIFHDITWLGGWTIGIVALAFLAETGKKIFLRHLLVLFVALLCLSPVNTLLKKTINRSRPARAFQEQIEEGTVNVRVVGERLRKKSLPSGHSALAFFFMTYVGFYKRAYRFWALLLASLIAFSRVYVGAHFPADCVAGALLGILGGWLAWKAFLYLSKRCENTA
ncbi:phosphatase PAP2 family protein [Verrucomicrobiota bacterium]